MVERHFPVILFAPPGVMLPGVKSLMSRLHPAMHFMMIL
jgi:hypothetical protein